MRPGSDGPPAAGTGHVYIHSPRSRAAGWRWRGPICFCVLGQRSEVRVLGQGSEVREPKVQVNSSEPDMKHILLFRVGGLADGPTPYWALKNLQRVKGRSQPGSSGTSWTGFPQHEAATTMSSPDPNSSDQRTGSKVRTSPCCQNNHCFLQPDGDLSE